ncbi:hypothetical protein FB451DRAFT_1165234 [Mycena latifolia]|nr:hypothetical protein FB451DRAFT_1165234 [Mycena latifolia]
MAEICHLTATATTSTTSIVLAAPAALQAWSAALRTKPLPQQTFYHSKTFYTSSWPFDSDVAKMFEHGRRYSLERGGGVAGVGGEGGGVLSRFSVQTFFSRPPQHAHGGQRLAEPRRARYKLQLGKHADLAPTFAAWPDIVADPTLDRKLASEVVIFELGMIMIISGTYFGTQDEYNALNFEQRLTKNTMAMSVLVLDDWLGIVGNWAETEALKLVGGISGLSPSSAPAPPPSTAAIRRRHPPTATRATRPLFPALSPPTTRNAPSISSGLAREPKRPTQRLFCLSKINVEALDIELLMYHILKKYMRRLYNFAAGTPFCSVIWAHSSVIELLTHVPQSVVDKQLLPSPNVGEQLSDISMSLQQMRFPIILIGETHVRITSAIRSAKGRLKDTPIPLAEHFSRFSNIPATLLHVGILSVDLNNEELRAAGCELLGAVCAYLNFDKSPIVAARSGFVPGDPTTFIIRLRDPAQRFAGGLPSPASMQNNPPRNPCKVCVDGFPHPLARSVTLHAIHARRSVRGNPPPRLHAWLAQMSAQGIATRIPCADIFR